MTVYTIEYISDKIKEIDVLKQENVKLIKRMDQLELKLKTHNHYRGL